MQNWLWKLIDKFYSSCHPLSFTGNWSFEGMNRKRSHWEAQKSKRKIYENFLSSKKKNRIRNFALLSLLKIKFSDNNGYDTFLRYKICSDSSFPLFVRVLWYPQIGEQLNAGYLQKKNSYTKIFEIFSTLSKVLGSLRGYLSTLHFLFPPFPPSMLDISSICWLEDDDDDVSYVIFDIPRVMIRYLGLETFRSELGKRKKYQNIDEITYKWIFLIDNIFCFVFFRCAHRLSRFDMHVIKSILYDFLASKFMFSLYIPFHNILLLLLCPMSKRWNTWLEDEEKM